MGSHGTFSHGGVSRGSLGAYRQRSVSCVWAVELSNGEVGRGDAGPGKVRQSWIVRERLGMVRTVKAVAGLVRLCLAVLVGAVMDCPVSAACGRDRQ